MRTCERPDLPVAGPSVARAVVRRSPERTYTKAALLNHYNLILFAALLLFSIAVGSPTLFLVGAGAELGYLAFVPQLGAFRRAVEAERERAEQAEAARRRWVLLAQMSETHRKKLEELEMLGDRIRENFRQRGEAIERLLSDTVSLSDLVARYARCALLYQAYHQHIGTTDRNKLEGEIESLEAAIPFSPDRLKELRVQRLAIAKSREERLEHARENLELVSQELAVIEELFQLMYEQSLAPRTPERLGLELDNIIRDLESSETTLIELSNFSEDQDVRALELGRVRAFVG